MKEKGEDSLIVNGSSISCLAVKEGPAELPWKEISVHVLEATCL